MKHFVESILIGMSVFTMIGIVFMIFWFIRFLILQVWP